MKFRHLSSLAVVAASIVSIAPVEAQVRYFAREKLQVVSGPSTSQYPGIWTEGAWTDTTACSGGSKEQTQTPSCTGGACDPSTKPATTRTVACTSTYSTCGAMIAGSGPSARGGYVSFRNNSSPDAALATCNAYMKSSKITYGGVCLQVSGDPTDPRNGTANYYAGSTLVSNYKGGGDGGNGTGTYSGSYCSM